MRRATRDGQNLQLKDTLMDKKEETDNIKYTKIQDFDGQTITGYLRL